MCVAVGVVAVGSYVDVVVVRCVGIDYVDVGVSAGVGCVVRVFLFLLVLLV